jgi:hypothetical protein
MWRSSCVISLAVALAACDGGADTVGERCGGFSAMTCGPNEYCDWAFDTCGLTDEEGICRSRPVGCPDPRPQPVCGCDGVGYQLACDANAAGVDLWQGDCTAFASPGG